MAEKDDDWGGVAVDVKNLSANLGPNGEPIRKPSAPKMSQSLPFMECPKVLDGSYAGDVGFDPLGFSKSPLDLTMYREAEIKHGRLAMLAAAGWPLSELFDRPIAEAMGWKVILDETNRAPSVLNGGLGKISPLYWGGILLVAAAIDVYGVFFASNGKGYTPGDLGFDPFGMYPKDEAGKKKMRLAEIKNGRLAMIAITAYAVHEFIGGTAVIDQTPIFFKPITTVISDYFSNSDGSSLPIPMTNELAPTSPAEVPGTVDILQFLESTTAPATEAAPTAAEAVTAVVPPPVAESVAEATSSAFTSAAPAVVTPAEVAEIAPPVTIPSSPVGETDLTAANQRIAELESQLKVIKDLTR